MQNKDISHHSVWSSLLLNNKLSKYSKVIRIPLQFCLISFYILFISSSLYGSYSFIYNYTHHTDYAKLINKINTLSEERTYYETNYNIANDHNKQYQIKIDAYYNRVQKLQSEINRLNQELQNQQSTQSNCPNITSNNPMPNEKTKSGPIYYVAPNRSTNVYHRIPNCCNMKSCFEVDEDYIKSNGLRPCKNCFH